MITTTNQKIANPSKKWDNVNLGDLITLEYGKGLSEKQRSYGKYPVYGSSGIVGYHDEALIKGPGLVVGRKGTIGSVSYSEKDFWPIDTAYYVKPLTDNIDKKWLFYKLTHLNLSKFNMSDVVPGLKRELVHAIEIGLPPLPEQRRIAIILITVDDAIQRSRHAAAETERIKAGVMHELMTKGIGHTEFREDPDVGIVPKDWKIFKLEDFCTSSAYGPRFSGAFYNTSGNVAVLRTTDLDSEGNISYEQMPRAKLNLTDFQEHILQANDLVITRSGTCGIGAIFSKYVLPVLPGAFLIRFRLSSEIDPQFLKQYINSRVGSTQITNLECGGIQKNLKGSALLKIKIPYPIPSEQKQIISILANIDSKLSLQRKRTAHYEKLKQGLMNELLTGKRRVKVS